MSTTGLSVFDETLQITNIWLNDVMARLGTDDRHRGYLALRTTLHALRDRLPPESAVHLAAQLPMLVRGIYYEGWRPSETPSPDRLRDEFLARIEAAFRRDWTADAEGIARGVFAVLADRLSDGEVGKVVHQLPREIRALWPDDAVSGER